MKLGAVEHIVYNFWPHSASAGLDTEMPVVLLNIEALVRGHCLNVAALFHVLL